MGLFNRNKKSKIETFFYSEHDQDSYEKLIEDSFGKFTEVIHEIISPDLHIDVIPVPPTAERNYYTLFTMGMGAYKMQVPSGYGTMNRAEMAIRLPADWDYKSSEEKWYWPIRVIKSLARLPFYEKTWLGYCHDIDFRGPFSEETERCGVLLDFFDESVEPLTLENGDRLIIYNVIPVYRAEMEYIAAHGAEALFQKMAEETAHGPLDIKRPCVV